MVAHLCYTKSSFECIVLGYFNVKLEFRPLGWICTVEGEEEDPVTYQ